MASTGTRYETRAVIYSPLLRLKPKRCTLKREGPEIQAYSLKTRAQGNLARCMMLTASALLARAQFPVEPSKADNNILPLSKDVVLNVVALDARGHPVTDLTSADFQIFDDGKPQQIVSFKAPSTRTPPPTTVILFDLLNSFPNHREYESGLIVHALERLGETGTSVYLDLLTNHGDLYPVGPPSTPQAETLPPQTRNSEQNGESTGTSWTRQVRPLLDRAIQNVYGLRPVDDADVGNRADVTFRTLGELGDRLAEVSGPKTIIWLTKGVPNWVAYPFGCQDAMFPEGSGNYLAGKCTSECRRAGTKCISYTPFLQHFSAKLNRTGTTVYSVEETDGGSLAPIDRGTSEDTLRQLADLTGGPKYPDGEVEKAIAHSLEDARTRYQFVYDAPAPDGKYHKLRVTCTRKGVRVEAQRGYFADRL